MQEYAHEYADIWYALPTPLQTSGGCWIVRAGRNRAKPHYEVGPKIIRQFGFHLVLSGTLKVSEGKVEVVLEKGDVFCLFPGRSYSYRSLSEDKSPLQMAWLAVDGPQASLLLAEAGLSPESFFGRQLMDHRVWGTLRLIFQGYETENLDPLKEQSLLMELFWRLKKQSSLSVKKDPKRHWLVRVKDYLELHSTEQITIETAAKYAGVHRSHLYASFMEAYGCSPMQYLQQLRMERGAQLLKESRLAVTEIALSLGYPDLYSFSRAFTKYYGLSPKTFRG
ncbi:MULTISPECIES: AraC family transcriptional regulator [unclassified Paenibacillus]|uniref:AraC family transcriptional regulator n=1 Tax=unclassified Paenibacillus TaxID=185978 RepID=UPI0027814720|nr:MULTISPECIES: AraC family transcriptional regulator [unclassified Paenibacillus]MDQ0900693.1 AraC-like DNA-binding protein [Paenibacillus sp. V4I7]MDQ0920798.1 AraC-like DNA-binding protein [Paenibacillus sp. V4I5]